MKKIYEKPEMKAIEIMNEAVMVSTSTPGISEQCLGDDEFFE